MVRIGFFSHVLVFMLKHVMENKTYEILNGFKTKKEAYNYFNITPNSVGILKLKKIANSVNFDLNIYAKRRSFKGNCIVCDKILEKKQKKFCSHSCSATHGNSNRTLTLETKQKISKSLTKERVIKKRKCKICGQETCINLEICNHTLKWFENLTPFGFNINVLGNDDIYLEYFRIKELLLKEYFDNMLSPYDISIKYNYNKSFENILHIFKSFGIKTRKTSDSVINSYLQGKLGNGCNSGNYQFKHGWHNTWDNKKIYYRSSYELNFAKDLDSKKIKYDVECFRIKYWDKQKRKYRVAIPDFHIPDSNNLYEIKSKITFNKQNIIDKFDEYIKLGFTPILVLDNIEYEYNDIFRLMENEFILGNGN